jgi:Na+-transporting methylmalonyl-CoA/oxaloacetate decarboxylase gamma subunit
VRTTFETHVVNAPPPIPPPSPPPFGDPTAIQKQNSSAVAKGILFGCGGCTVILAGMAAVFAVVLFGVFAAIGNSDAVAAAIKQASASPEVQRALGTPIEREWLTTGSVETANGDSSADVHIPIKGPKGSAKIRAVGHKRKGGEWVFTVLEVTIAATQETINLLKAGQSLPAEAPNTIRI